MDKTLIKFNELYSLVPFGLYNNNILCYFNALLQSLFSCTSINEYLLNNENKFSNNNFIKLYKKEHGDYKILAYDLQKAESNLIFNKMIKTIMNLHPEIKIITIHDSIVVQKKYRDIVNNIFQNEISKEFNLI